MRIIKNHGKIREVTGKYILEGHIKSDGRPAYADISLKTIFWGIMYELGIIKWGNAKENRGS